MNQSKPPIAILILAFIYIAIGAIGSIYHFSDLRASLSEGIPIEVTELVALISGVFLLRGSNWARWLALSWIAFHVILSAFHNIRELAVHGVACALIAWLLFRPEGDRYFRGGAPPAPNQL